MDKKIVGAISGGYFARLDRNEPTRIYLDRPAVGPDEKIEVTQPNGPNGKFKLRFRGADRIITALGKPDAPIGSYVREFETRPSDQWGPSEQFEIVVMPDGTILATAPYLFEGRQYWSTPLTLVEVAE